MRPRAAVDWARAEGGSLRGTGEPSHQHEASDEPKLASQVSGLLCEPAPLKMAATGLIGASCFLV